MRIAIIGAGIGGLGTACLLSKAGHRVTIFEKNNQAGGRAGSLESKGFRFDTGPSWYLMPEVFEAFFNILGEDINDYLDLIKLDPSCRITFANGQQIDISDNLQTNKQTFEAIESGAGKQLEDFLARADYIYKTSSEKFLYKNYDSIKSLLSPALIRDAKKLSLFKSLDKYVEAYFKDTRLQQAVSFPSVFLGTSPAQSPAFYSLLDHTVFNQDVFYPKGGIYGLIKSLQFIAKKHGTILKFNAPVTKLLTKGTEISGVIAAGKTYAADIVISDAGIQYTESSLLTEPERDHSPSYWRSRRLAPSALLIYLGIDRKYDTLVHHNLIFGSDWRQNFSQIYDRPAWPEDPSFYVCAPSRTDSSVAPKDNESLFVLVPIAAGLDYTPKELEKYTGKILETMEKSLNLKDLRQHIILKKTFCVKDFASRFNSPQGTGLGLAHTLKQSAAWRPQNYSRKVKGLYYVGADVHPGIGLPTCLISAELVAKRLAE